MTTAALPTYKCKIERIRKRVFKRMFGLNKVPGWKRLEKVGNYCTGLEESTWIERGLWFVNGH